MIHIVAQFAIVVIATALEIQKDRLPEMLAMTSLTFMTSTRMVHWILWMSKWAFPVVSGACRSAIAREYTSLRLCVSMDIGVQH